VEQANWFNKIVAAAWPYLDEATSNAITRALDPILKATRPTFLTSLRFERFSFGSVPAIIQGVKVYDTQDRGAVEIDLEIFWAGDPDVVLGIRAANDTLNVPVSLTELQCAFKLRLIFAPLIGVFPCFGALTIALVEEPSLDFDLRVVGGDITLVPGISQPLRTYIKALIGSYLVWPRFITVPMPGTGYAVPKTSFEKSVPDGSLEITLNSRNGEYIGDEIGCQVSWQTNNIIENLEESRFRTLIEPTESSSIQISVQDVLNQSLILNWYSRNSLEASHVVGQACIPLHELLKNVSGNLIRESSNIDLGDFVIEFENITKKNGASHDKSINEVVSNFSRVRNRFTKILPDVKEIRTPAVNPTSDSKIIQVRILYFPTSGTVNNK
jgi:Ca2+-dependent lipid-binding protein